MKKVITLFLILFLTTSVFAQRKADVLSRLKVNNAADYSYSTNNTGNNSGNWTTVRNIYAPAGSVPFPLNFNDYATNGACIKKILVFGDTIVIGADINPDLTLPAPNAAAGHTFYQVSYDGGLTWLSDAVNLSPSTSTRWPNLTGVYISGTKALLMTGRIYVNNSTGTQKGLSIIDAIFGIGSTNNYIVPDVQRDYFGDYINSTTTGGIVGSPASNATDSLYYVPFNYQTNTYGAKVLVTYPLEENFRYFFASASNGQNILAANWKTTTNGFYGHESTNGGTTFTDYTIFSGLAYINGDSVSGYFGADFTYKPGTTQKAGVFSTIGPGNYLYPEKCKILYVNPTINSGNPVVVCDWQKYFYLKDTSATGLFYNNFRKTQIGVTLFSHPTIGYSDDGSTLYCAFSATQKDTLAASPTWNYNDIFVCKSTDDGATWGSAFYVTNTAKLDELYPSISKKGNTNTTFNIVYNVTGTPGSYSFTDNSAPDTVYSVFKRLVFDNLALVPVGVRNISTVVPDKFSLNQNYPNPFNPSTTIRFAIPRDTKVTLKVYDITGKVVAVLIDNQTVKTGTNEVTFDASGFSSGVYFYRIVSNNFQETKKMMLIK